MGAGVSTVNRLRKAIILRAYNIRDKNETLEEQFKRHTYKKVMHNYEFNLVNSLLVIFYIG
jgi:hypothetical protein